MRIAPQSINEVGQILRVIWSKIDALDSDTSSLSAKHKSLVRSLRGLTHLVPSGSVLLENGTDYWITEDSESIALEWGNIERDGETHATIALLEDGYAWLTETSDFILLEDGNIDRERGGPNGQLTEVTLVGEYSSEPWEGEQAPPPVAL